jgi:hypothetical protein
MTSFGMRMLRAAWLHADTYEEIEADRSAIWQATVVVIGACTAIGLARYVQSSGAGIPANPLVLQVALSIAEPLVLWFGGSAFVFMVGATFFRGPETETDFAEVLRTTPGPRHRPGRARLGLRRLRRRDPSGAGLQHRARHRNVWIRGPAAVADAVGPLRRTAAFLTRGGAGHGDDSSGSIQAVSLRVHSAERIP